VTFKSVTIVEEYEKSRWTLPLFFTEDLVASITFPPTRPTSGVGQAVGLAVGSAEGVAEVGFNVGLNVSPRHAPLPLQTSSTVLSSPSLHAVP